MLRVVLDADVLISAAISRGPLHRIVQVLLREVRSVLTDRPRVRKWIALEAADLYVTTLAVAADVLPDPSAGTSADSRP